MKGRQKEGLLAGLPSLSERSPAADSDSHTGAQHTEDSHGDVEAGRAPLGVGDFPRESTGSDSPDRGQGAESVDYSLNAPAVLATGEDATAPNTTSHLLAAELSPPAERDTRGDTASSEDVELSFIAPKRPTTPPPLPSVTESPRSVAEDVLTPVTSALIEGSGIDETPKRSARPGSVRTISFAVPDLTPRDKENEGESSSSSDEEKSTERRKVRAPSIKDTLTPPPRVHRQDSNVWDESTWQDLRLSTGSFARMREFLQGLAPDEVLPPKEGLAPCVMSGLLSGLYFSMGCVALSGVVFSNVEAINPSALPAGISMYLFSTFMLGVLNTTFGSLPFALTGPQDTPSFILSEVAMILVEEVEQEEVIPTLLLIMCLASVMTGAVFMLIGSLKMAKFLEMFPFPVMGGFLAAIGYFLFKAGIQLMSGMKISYVVPEDWGTFSDGVTLAKLFTGLGYLALIRVLPPLLRHRISDERVLLKSFVSPCVILLPIPFFYAIVAIAGVEISTLRENGWLYNEQPSVPFYTFWSLMDFSKSQCFKVMPSVFGKIGVLVMLSTLAAILNLVAIDTDAKSEKRLNLNKNVIILGANSLVCGSLGGVVGYHQVGLSLNNKNNGGVARLSGYMAALFCLVLLLSGVPISSIVPKFFTGALSCNIGYGFLKTWVWQSYKKVLKWEYLILWITLVITVVMDLVIGIASGLAISNLLFIRNAATIDPVKVSVRGDIFRSTTRRPLRQVEKLTKLGHKLLVLRLQGFLFFGSAEKVNKTLSAVLEGGDKDPQYVIFDFTFVPSMDTSASQVFMRAKTLAEVRDITLIFTNLSPHIKTLLRRDKVITKEAAKMQGDINYRFSSKLEGNVFSDVDLALEWCENVLLTKYTIKKEMRKGEDETEPVRDIVLRRPTLQAVRSGSVVGGGGLLSPEHLAAAGLLPPTEGQRRLSTSRDSTCSSLSGVTEGTEEAPQAIGGDLAPPRRRSAAARRRSTLAGRYDMALQTKFLKYTAGLSQDAFKRLETTYMQKMDFKAGHMVFGMGEESNCFYLVRLGILILHYVDENGNKTRLCNVQDGAMAGVDDFFLNRPRTSELSCATPAVVYKLSRSALDTLTSNDPALANQLLELVIKETSLLSLVLTPTKF